MPGEPGLCSSQQQWGGERGERVMWLQPRMLCVAPSGHQGCAMCICSRCWQRCLLNINASKQRFICKVCSKVCSSFFRARTARQVNTQALNVIRPRAISSITARMWICDSLWTGGVCVGAEKMSTHLLKELGPCLICEVTYVIKALNFWPAIVWKLCQHELTMSTHVECKNEILKTVMFFLLMSLKLHISTP